MARTNLKSKKRIRKIEHLKDCRVSGKYSREKARKKGLFHMNMSPEDVQDAIGHLYSDSAGESPSKDGKRDKSRSKRRKDTK